MVRRCPVGNCRETDHTILAHRFPHNLEIAKKWQETLNLQEYSVDELFKKFVVCTKHFKASAYRNEISNSLNTTALPNLLKNTENERIVKTCQGAKVDRNLLPARCHKLPPNIISFLKEANEQTESRPKRPRNGMEFLQKTKEERQELNVVTITDIIPVEEVSETFEVFEMDEADVPPEQSSEEKEIFGAVDEVPDVTARKVVTSKSLNDQETQTDPPPLQESSVPPEPPFIDKTSKDDKLIEILYPEFKALEKIQLIELLNERSRKIESLEEKVKKLEMAMRNLL